MQPTVLVDAPERLDGTNAGGFGSFLTNLIEAGAHRLILDLGALDYLSSAGVRALLMTHQALQARSGKMVFLSCRPSVREVLRICGMEQMAPKAESIEAARRWVT
jgi:stage II sporulation protein AA (anti-sigma F factor antagonist)